MEGGTHWLTETEARAIAAEKQRDEAVARASALEDRLGKVEQVIQEQQDAIEEMHQAWLAAKGGGGGGYGIGGVGQEELAQLQAEVDELHRRLARGDGVNGLPSRHAQEACTLRAEQAEGRADALERKIEQLSSQAEEREQQLRMLSTAAQQVVTQTRRIAELEGICFEREQQIAKLQVLAVGLESAKQDKQIMETEKKTLLKRAMEAEGRATQAEEKARKEEKARMETARVVSTSEAEKELLRKHLTEEFAREFASLNERFEREYSAARQRAAQAELDARTSAQKAAAEAQQREAAVKKLEEAASLQKQRAELELGKTTDQRLKRLSNHELQALQQRLNAAEARAGAAESKRKECEQELASAKQAVESHLEEVREAQRERAQAVEALEAARVAREGQVADVSRRVSSLAQLQAERDALREQLASQKRSFDRELEDIRAEMKLCEEALAVSGQSGAGQVRQGFDHSRRSTAASSLMSPSAYTPQSRSANFQLTSSGTGRSPSLSPLRVRQVVPHSSSLTVPTSVEVHTTKGGVTPATGSTPPGSSRIEVQTTLGQTPGTPLSMTNRPRRISGSAPVASSSSASMPLAASNLQSTNRVVTSSAVTFGKPLLC